MNKREKDPRIWPAIGMAVTFLTLFIVALSIGPIFIPFDMVKPLLMLWIVMDAFISMEMFKEQRRHEHALRISRVFVTMAWFFGILNPVVAGFLLVVDGLYSIARYRYYRMTKGPLDYLPRVARVEFGLWIMMGISITVPTLSLF